MSIQPRQPTVMMIEGGKAARWTFDTDDRAEQQRQFDYWCGWFGFDESDEPERVEGQTWVVRQRYK
jgi:hypothetical protein